MIHKGGSVVDWSWPLLGRENEQNPGDHRRIFGTVMSPREATESYKVLGQCKDPSLGKIFRCES